MIQEERSTLSCVTRTRTNLLAFTSVRVACFCALALIDRIKNHTVPKMGENGAGR